MIWVYVAALGAAVLLVAGAGLWWWTRSQRRAYSVTEIPERPADTAESMAPESIAAEHRTEKPGESAAVGSRETPVPSDTSEREHVSVEETVQPGRPADSRGREDVRLCPECDRSFPASYVVCPFDSTALLTMDRGGGSRADVSDMGSGHKRCPTCDRRYYPGQTYCYRDGSELVAEPDDREPATGESAWRVCPDCGREAQTDKRLCPEDGTELLRVGLERTGHGRTTPPVPLMRCPECGESALPGQARCPEDGTLLTPIQNETLAQFPTRGLGPRRKVCPDCGETYSRAARYCASDGAELVERN
jgi:uncharacterized OB-fold protein